MKKLKWVVNRLQCMSAPEIIHRVHEQRVRAVFRRKGAPPAGDLLVGDALPCWPGLRDRLRAYPQREALLRQLQDAAAEMEAGVYKRLGEPLNMTPPLYNDWFRDPATGGDWPSAPYCYDIAFRQQEGLGDIKYVWEVNRLQHLQALAFLACLKDDAARADYVWSSLESWIDDNPPFRGVNWNSGIELALRAVSMVLIASVLPPPSPQLQRKLIESLAYHAFWIDQYPSLHSSANNHLIAEAAALFILGTLTSSLAEAERYAAYGREALNREALLQILPDGMGAEQSPTYAAFTIEWLALSAEIGRLTGRPLDPALDARLTAAGDHFEWLLGDADEPPAIGDDDEGSVCFNEPSRYVRSVYAAIGNHALADGETDAAGVLHAVLFKPETATPAPAPPEGVKAFEAGGLTTREHTFMRKGPGQSSVGKR